MEFGRENAAMNGPDPILTRPRFTPEGAASIAIHHFAIVGEAVELPSERDQNFRIETDGQGTFLLKIANPQTSREILELENQAIQLAGATDEFAPLKLHRSRSRQKITPVEDPAGNICQARMLDWISGCPFAELEAPTPELIFQIGAALARLDESLAPLTQLVHSRRELKWDLERAPQAIRRRLESDLSEHQRALLEEALARVEGVAARVAELPAAVIHNDPNDHNILVREGDVQFIDFGDLLRSRTICDLAICGAYVTLGVNDPLSRLLPLVEGYDSVRPLEQEELAVLFPLLTARLGQSVSLASEQHSWQPDNDYLTISQGPAWAALERWLGLEPEEVRMRLAEQCLRRYAADPEMSQGPELLAARRHWLAPSLSLSYDRPLHIVRGQGQYLFDENGARYLDCVNNVCHVGHCHPAVVEAAADQMASLNTNTRYLHRAVVDYARELTRTFPEGLDVCFFVNSGSEANDLALRLARCFTGHRDVAVVDHAYHGHVSSLIEISPYKFQGPGGQGCPPHVHVVPAPDLYRGPIREDDAAPGPRYAELAMAALEQSSGGPDHPLAAFFAESLLGCGGQVPLPDGYLATLYPAIRERGGVCIADEVQVGFGRTGDGYWGFESQGVVPDIVTLGKPIGNGHPLGAVVTRREIAEAFHNGMEYFNTFGGNPVSARVGLAVLKVIRDEGLIAHAARVGAFLVEQLSGLQERHPSLGDVRGRGLFLGLEMVRDPKTRDPDPEWAHLLVQRMREQHILLSTDGPDHNVIKFKPPMAFTLGDAERLVMVLDQTLARSSR